MSFDTELNQKISEINEIIKGYLPKEEGFQKIAAEAMNYSILAGGKRIRPLLMREFYKSFGGSNEEIINPFMAAIEMIHTYSLVHDDLPAMDNDMLRRGKPTTHAKYGEAIGILAGDGLLNYAAETALSVTGIFSKECTEDNYKNIYNSLRASKMLFNYSGLYGMLGGQTVDVVNTGRQLEEDELMFMYELKTGALIEASISIGAVLASCDDTTVEIVTKIAKKIGIAFQIQDDILDICSDTQTLGKTVLSDENNNKITYVSIYGLEESKEKVREITEEALELYDSLKINNDFLRELIYKLALRKF